MKDWTITQDPYTCVGTLGEYLPTKIALTYSDEVSSEIVTPVIENPTITAYDSFASTWDKILENSDPENCPINDCKIYPAGSCGSGTFTGIGNIAISSTLPWDITASRSNFNGYSHNICVRCSNGVPEGIHGQDYTDIDNWKIN